MGRWRAGAGWVALVVLLVAGAGVAAALPGSSPLRRDPSASLATAGAAAGEVPVERTATTVGPTVPPTTAVTAPTTTARAAPTPTTRPGAVPTTARPFVAPQPGPTTSTLGPGQTAPTVPPPANPAAWDFEQDGLAVRIRIAPIAPHVGDTVTFTIESWTDLPGVTCCNVTLQFGNDIVFRRATEPDPCPQAPPRQDVVGYRFTEPTVSPLPGPFVTVGLILRVTSNFKLCAGVQGPARYGEFGVPVVLRLPGS